MYVVGGWEWFEIEKLELQSKAQGLDRVNQLKT